MDGFFLSINNVKTKSFSISNHKRLIEIMTNYYMTIQNDSFFDYHLLNK